MQTAIPRREKQNARYCRYQVADARSQCRPLDSHLQRNHKGFSAKKFFDENGKIKWGAIAYIEKGGGGPEGNHTHSDNHIFIVVDGEAKVILDDKEVIVKKNESYFVDGMVPHSIWNNADRTTVVIKISTEREQSI